MSKKTRNILGWTLTALIAIPFVMTGVIKLSLGSTALEQAKMLGIEPETFRLMGAVEMFSLGLFILPRTGIVGTLLLVAYAGGIMSAEIMHELPPVTSFIMQVVIWITSAIRFPELTQRLFNPDKKALS